MTNNLLLPYYEHPSVRPAEWDAIIAAAPHLYAVVLNPASGPGDHPDEAFVEVAARLRAAGTRTLGYVDTAYARRPRADVVRDLTHHHDWYATDGAFLDQVAAGEPEFTYYRRLATAVRGTLALNHGTAPHPSYARIADVLVTFEGPWTSYLHLGPPQWRGTSDVRLCHLVYGVPRGADLAVHGADLYCGVPGMGDHPWGTLPHTLEPAQ
ncbi:spherulation-specific family 4 protein [Streptomyces sp. NPDC051913]|uniref:spherulation-specific family 4 protein n=1 Tax=Streptomyces sp. NPDC051913 TaxID=3365676 RepID=UPI0037D02204